MIISKTPLRISFFGGGTDYPDYFKKYGGAVLSVSINKYIYITVNKISTISEFPYKVAYSKVEHCQSIAEIIHPSVRASLGFMKMNDGIEIHTISDLPAKTGLGASSSFTVGLLNALYAHKGEKVPSLRLAQDAIFVEQKLIGEKVGVQDQCAAAIGGLNYFEFHPDGSITYKPASLKNERKQKLKENLLLFYTGVQRYAENVLNEQIDKTKKGELSKDLFRIRQMVDDGYNLLTSERNLDEFGELLNEAWISKKNLSSAISSKYLDDIYSRAMKAGALGGKLLGAGGGGFFLFYASRSEHENLRLALRDYQEIDFDFDSDGSKIIFVHEN
jgi:D-glycero-alpha-D-manno-heptose-7-phosphate kinase